MGTRSLTRFFDEYSNVEIACLYRQFDGYPTGHGVELARFVAERSMVNGMRAGETRKTANGMGCLAAQVVCWFKSHVVKHGEESRFDGENPTPGGFYLYAPGSHDVGEEYVYEVRKDSFRAFHGGDPEPFYDGTAAGFLESEWSKD